MKKRVLSVFLVLCLIFTLLPVTASAAGTEMMQIGTEMRKSWSSQTDSTMFLLKIENAGFYDLTVNDYNCTGEVNVFFEGEDDAPSYAYHSFVHNFAADTGSNQYTQRHIYLAEGVYELTCFYSDSGFNALDADIGLTINADDSYSPTELTAAGEYFDFAANEFETFTFRTGEKGDYILKCSRDVKSYLTIYDRSTSKIVALLDNFGEYSAYRFNLKANTDYLIVSQSYYSVVSGISYSGDTVTSKISMSKADKDVTKVSLSYALALPDTYIYEVLDNTDYKITYSDNTTDIIKQFGYDCEYFTIDIEYNGKYNNTNPDEELYATGKQSVILSYLNKESSSSVNVISFVELVSDFNPVAEYEDMYLVYEDQYAKTLYWHIKPTETAYYDFFSYDGWNTTLDYCDFTIFDESDKYVERDESGQEFLLRGGHDYCLRVNYCFASDDYDIFTFWMEKTDTEVAPAAPVIKITTSAGKPKISWSKVDGAVKYQVYRSTDGKKYSLLATTTGTSITNTKAKIGTTYYYKVKAVNASGAMSAYSNTKSIKCRPAAPTVTISRSGGKAKLSWKAVSGATKYWVYRSTDGKKYTRVISTTKLSYTDSKSKSGTKYYYKVMAVAVVNETNVGSACSAVKSIITTLAKPTVKITTSNGKPKLSWSKVTGADKYYVYRSTDGKTFKHFATTTKLSYTNTSAKKGTKYYYKVKAICSANTNANSAFSTVVSIKATK